MIVVRLQNVAKKAGIENAYQLQKLTGFHPGMSSKLWKEKWKVSNLKTLNTLCTALKCSPNDLLEFQPDEEPEDR